MNLQKAEFLFIKFMPVIFIIAVISLCIAILYAEKTLETAKNKAKIEEKATCETEAQLQFNGVITEYNGRGYKSSPIIFMIKDSIYQIPRYNTTMSLFVGDTIKKNKDEHTYYIKRNEQFSQNVTGHKLDTFIFNCK